MQGVDGSSPPILTRMKPRTVLTVCGFFIFAKIRLDQKNSWGIFGTSFFVISQAFNKIGHKNLADPLFSAHRKSDKK